MAYEFVITGLALLTVIGQIFVLFSILCLINLKPFNSIRKFLGRFNVEIAFIVALTATLGSLFFSEVLQWTPCELCWFQRIFMYPQVIILGIALIKKDRHIKYYSLGLSIVGIIISTYHNYIQRFNIPTSCSFGDASCLTQYTLKFGYITIPLMAFTAFAMIIVLFTVYERKGSAEKQA